MNLSNKAWPLRRLLSSQPVSKEICKNQFHKTCKNLAETGKISKYCFNSVKTYDYENYLALLLLKESKLKAHAFAIRAFNVELARAHSVTTQNTISEMRLKFWDDTIDKIYDKGGDKPIPEHPVARQLKTTINEAKLSKQYFKRLIKSRQKTGNLTFLTKTEMEDYCDNSVSSVYYLFLEAAGIRNVNTDHAASHLGKAQGIVNLLRSLVYQSREKYTIPVPQEICMRHGISQERILRDQKEDKGVEEAVFEVATVAHQHLEKSRNLKRSDFPKEVLQLFLPAVAVERYLERLRRADFHVTSPNLQTRDNLLPYYYLMAKLKRRF